MPSVVAVGHGTTGVGGAFKAVRGHGAYSLHHRRRGTPCSAISTAPPRTRALLTSPPPRTRALLTSPCIATAWTHTRRTPDAHQMDRVTHPPVPVRVVWGARFGLSTFGVRGGCVRAAWRWSHHNYSQCASISTSVSQNRRLLRNLQKVRPYIDASCAPSDPRRARGDG